VTIALLVCGVNSDLFGRHWFIVGSHPILFIGYIVDGTARNVLRTTALSSPSFCALVIVACLFSNGLGAKMDNKIEVSLENDENAEKNKYH
jgi:hypothetical protein